MARITRANSHHPIRNLAIARFLVLAFAVSGAQSASADVDVYLAPQIGISAMTGETGGRVAILNPASFAFQGEDTDSSPLVGVSLGLEIPMDEIVPREWLPNIRIPNWPVRFEFEYTDLREHELKTNGFGSGAADYNTEVTSRTFVANSWVDVPFTTIWRPVQYVFGLGRQPRMRQWLEPGGFYLGGGIGFSEVEIDGSDNQFTGEDEALEFSWNVGTGVNYAISERVTISAGYRYLSLGPDADYTLDLTGGTGFNDELDYTLEVHEFRVGIQVNLFSFRGAWR